MFAFLPKICCSTSIFQDFCSDLLCSYLSRDFRNFTNFCFPENLLVAAANRFKVLKINIFLKFMEYIQDRRLESEKAMDALDFKWKSNCTKMVKYACDFKHKIYCNIYIYIYIAKHIVKQLTLHPAETYSEPFLTSKQGRYLIGGNYLHEKLHLRCLKRF